MNEKGIFFSSYLYDILLSQLMSCDILLLMTSQEGFLNVEMIR